MTKREGKGVEVLLQLADSALRQLTGNDARAFVDGLDDKELAWVMTALSSANKATGGTPNLFYESAAARLLGVDVAVQGSEPEENALVQAIDDMDGGPN